MANTEALKTKADVIAQILKFDGPFRPAYIREYLDLSKQNMRYHLKSLVEKGVLEQQGQLYMLIDKDKAIDLMLDIAHNERGISRSEPTTVFNGTAMRELVDAIHKAKALGLIESDAMKKHMSDEIDRAIRELTKEKKYLNEKSLSAGSARKSIWKNYNFATDWYTAVMQALKDFKFEFETEEVQRINDFNRKVEETD